MLSHQSSLYVGAQIICAPRMSGLVSVVTQTAFSDVSQTIGSDGISDSSSTAEFVIHEGIYLYSCLA